jgi:hypothetical protein
VSASGVWRLTASSVAAAGLAAVSACGSGSTSSASIATNPPVTQSSPSGSPSPSAGIGGQRTVLSVLGLNIRDAPAGKPTGAVLAQGAVVTVLDHSDQNGPCDGKGGWFKVKAQTTTGWIADCDYYTSPHLFNLYQSDAQGFSALYYQEWTFGEQPDGVVFRPQSGSQTILLTIAKSVDALGSPGRAGYAVTTADTILVYGVTGILRIYDRGGSPVVSSPTPSTITPLAHLAEFRATIDSSRAIRIDFNYSNATDLAAFRDFYNSVIFPAPATPASSPTPHP